MRNHYNSRRFKEWLDKLQQESWQLELIISGFAIYGLFQALEPLIELFKTVENQNNIVVTMFSVAALFSCSILIFSLVLHVILRGLWIGALGLRYVSGDIEYKKLNYSPKFDKHLRKRIGSFDKYISKLEDYCSIIFALSFLLIFYVFSIFLTVGAIASIAYLTLSGISDGNEIKPKRVIGILLLVFLSFGMIFTFIDFVTQGYLKKKKWLSFIYFPFYWVFSFITLSFLYRPLVYNFLDNKLGKRISYVLIPIYFIITTLITFRYNRSNYLSINRDSDIIYADKRNYNNLLTEKGEFINDVSIPSKIIETPYLNIFIEYTERIEDDIFRHNKSLKPTKDKRGLISTMFNKNTISRSKRDSLRKVYLNNFKEIHIIKIDSIEYSTLDFVYTQNDKRQEGFETFANIKSLQPGKHLLHVSRLRKVKENSVRTINIATIPFWYYPN
ncbi:hypothetical protein [uncultured Lacinutrix sp.]|uniref:hypothetical protein n=1 Tax=uncultured Lacinutrix sp. TaxID=574032 RepID=UPI002617BBF3|nr:hypothetical protein [uncultured Lacinutrix sp.]